MCSRMLVIGKNGEEISLVGYLNLLTLRHRAVAGRIGDVGPP